MIAYRHVIGLAFHRRAPFERALIALTLRFGDFARSPDAAELLFHFFGHGFDICRVELMLLVQESGEQETVAQQVDAAWNSIGEGKNSGVGRVVKLGILRP